MTFKTCFDVNFVVVYAFSKMFFSYSYRQFIMLECLKAVRGQDQWTFLVINYETLMHGLLSIIFEPRVL